MLTSDLREAVCRKAENLDLELVVLFGSTAQGKASPRDLDLALSPRASGAIKPDDLWSDWAKDLGRGDLDLVWLPNASWLVHQQVARHGTPLYQASPGRFHDFCLRAALRSASSDPWRRRERRYLERVFEGGFRLQKDLVHRKTVQFAQYLKELEAVLGQGPCQFETTPLHYAGERLLELLVECAAYINTEVAQAQAGIPPSDYYSSFFSMAQTGWIGQQLALELAPYTRLRNALVHRYEEVALESFYQELEASLGLWQAYLESVVERIKSLR